MSYLGDIRLGDTLDTAFTTRQISGAPFTLAGSPVISAYPANSTTELTAGITLTVDFDARTGLNHVRVVASGGNGYLTATDYQLVITTGTVNSVSVVGEVIGEFSIEHRSALMPATAGRTVVVDAAGLIDATMVKSGPTGSGTAQTARDLGAGVIAATVSDKTGYSTNDFTTQLTESYAALHTVPTPAQAILEIRAILAEASVSGTVLTAKKIDGAATAETFTLNSASAPTAVTRAT